MENKIFYIMGKSGVGKTTIMNMLRDDMREGFLYKASNYKFKSLIQHTTRPKRDEDIDGETYIFSTEEDFIRDFKKDIVVEWKSYDTVKGKWIYYTTIDSIDLNNFSYIGTGNPYSFYKLQKHFGEKIIPIMITLDDNIRFFRLLDREKESRNMDMLEFCRRFMADNDDFCYEKIKELVSPRYIELHSFENIDLQGCYWEILKFILDNLKK